MKKPTTTATVVRAICDKSLVFGTDGERGKIPRKNMTMKPQRPRWPWSSGGDGRHGENKYYNDESEGRGADRGIS